MDGYDETGITQKLSYDSVGRIIKITRDSVSANALEVVIHHLRRKLGNETIQTIRGVGYMIGGNR